MKTLKKGSRGEEVKTLQTLLGITADGIFGPITKSAVIAYQTANGLKADGIVGPLTWAALGKSSPQEPKDKPVYKQPVDYKQYDSKWAAKMYSSHGDKKQTMRSSACGPTAMADIIATLIDPSVTPPVLADKAVAWGDRSYSSGTNWSFFQHIKNEYPFSDYKKSTSITDLKNCLDSGGYVVCSMGKGYWTNGGHYICAWKYDGDYIYANDPASSKRKKQSISQFMKERKAFFCFWK